MKVFGIYLGKNFEFEDGSKCNSIHPTVVKHDAGEIGSGNMITHNGNGKKRLLKQEETDIEVHNDSFITEDSQTFEFVIKNGKKIKIGKFYEK